MKVYYTDHQKLLDAIRLCVAFIYIIVVVEKQKQIITISYEGKGISIFHEECSIANCKCLPVSGF